jgi:hypothetical protein
MSTFGKSPSVIKEETTREINDFHKLMKCRLISAAVLASTVEIYQF